MLDSGRLASTAVTAALLLAGAAGAAAAESLASDGFRGAPPEVRLDAQQCNTRCQTDYADCLDRCDGAVACQRQCDGAVAACVARCSAPQVPPSGAPSPSGSAAPRAPLPAPSGSAPPKATRPAPGGSGSAVGR